MSNSPSRAPMAGGFLLALCVLAGAVTGALKGEPSLGFLIGTGIGVAVAVAVWLVDRGRR